MRIGVDVGGTNTDAVLMAGRKVLAWNKVSTTKNVSDGIFEAAQALLEQSAVTPEAVEAVMVGTTHFINAFIERRELSKAAVVRIALPATSGVPPMTDWPADVVRALGDHRYLVQGGYQYDGRENAPLDEKAVAAAARDVRSKHIESVAIVGLFSPVLASMEERAEEILRSEIPDANITLSSRIGRIGLLERENAAIINASLSKVAENVLAALRDAFKRLNITCPIYMSQNDGTLMDADFAKKYPVLTFSSGATNSMRGGAYLSGLKDAVIVDIGGTTTDFGVLSNGFPRESAFAAKLGGVRMNFRMPEVLSIGLGGGSIVSRNAGQVAIGPRSVGYRLRQDAKVFGGEVLTATDIAVAAGFTDIGDSGFVKEISSDLIENAVDAIHQLIEQGVDQVKISADDIPLVLVGGGSILVNRVILGTSEIIIPEYANVANAVGAAIAQIGGEIDRVFSYDRLGREAAMKEAKSHAVDAAIEAGAAQDTVEVVEIDEIPLAYVPGGSVRLRIKAVGDLFQGS